MSESQSNVPLDFLLPALKYLFREYATEHNLDTVQMLNAKMKSFALWIQPRLEALLDVEDSDGRVQISPGAKDALLQIWDDPYSLCSVLFPMWSLLICSGYAPSKHKILSLECQVELKYADGEVATINSGAPFWKQPQHRATTALVAAMIQQHMRAFQVIVQDHGTDKLHDAFAGHHAEIKAKQGPDGPRGPDSPTIEEKLLPGQRDHADSGEAQQPPDAANDS